MNKVMKDIYLAHYGIRGQKWGVRRFQKYPKGYNGDGKFVSENKKEVKAKLYKQREYDKAEQYYNKKISKYESKGQVTKIKAAKSVMDAELKYIKNMSVEDVSNERKHVGKKYAMAAMTSGLGAAALTVATGSPTAFVLIPRRRSVVSNYRAIKDSNYRKARTNAYDKGFKG